MSRTAQPGPRPQRMVDRSMRSWFLTGALLAPWLTLGSAAADVPGSRDVHGKLAHLQGVRVLRLWGLPEEQGYAQGYLLGPEIVELLDKYRPFRPGADQAHFTL